MIQVSEHFKFTNGQLRESDLAYLKLLGDIQSSSCFKGQKDRICLDLKISTQADNVSVDLDTSYYVGVTRLAEIDRAFFIHSKLDDEHGEVNVLKMFFEALQEPENFEHLDDLYDIRLHERPVLIEQKKDLLSPFLIIQFASLVKRLVTKGLKKSYYPVMENLTNRIKGKILIGQQLKNNVPKSKATSTFCAFQEFGADTKVNRFIKYVLRVARIYLARYNFDDQGELNNIFNFCSPPFSSVSDQRFNAGFVYRETNPFYKIYNDIVHLGNLILRMESFSVSQKKADSTYYVPPYWIDMSRLFELYVFKKLRESFPLKGQVSYHRKFSYQEPDFILNTDEHQVIIDAKYKPRYAHVNISIDDARQLSGYSRLRTIQEEFGHINPNDYCILDCLIVYSDQANEINPDLADSSTWQLESKYIRIYKTGIALPIL